MAGYEWSYAIDGVQGGPVDEAGLRRLASSGSLKPTDLVWRDGMGDWVPASNVPGLFTSGPVAASTPVTPPVAIAAPAPAAAYQAAGAVLPYRGGGPGYGNAASVSPTAVELLRQTRPWVMLFSVLMFIGAGVAFLAGIFVIIAGLAGGARGLGAGACVGIMPILGGLLYFFPALFLGRYASRIGNLAASSRTDDLENALDAQKSFWKFMGILTSIVLVLYLLMIIIAIIGGVFAASAGRGGGPRFGP